MRIGFALISSKFVNFENNMEERLLCCWIALYLYNSVTRFVQFLMFWTPHNIGWGIHMSPLFVGRTFLQVYRSCTCKKFSQQQDLLFCFEITWSYVLAYETECECGHLTIKRFEDRAVWDVVLIHILLDEES